jgi:hypothetical protein
MKGDLRGTGRLAQARHATALDDIMPFKSKAQRRKFAELLVKGEISPETYEEWNRETGRATLPERVKRPTKRTRTLRRKPSQKTATGARSKKKVAAKRR